MSMSVKERTAIEAHVKKVVAEAPPLSEWQINKIRSLLGAYGPEGARRYSPHVKSETEAAIDRARRDLSKVERDYREALISCHACDVPQEKHFYAQRNAIHKHAFVPLAVDDVIKVSGVFKARIDEARATLRNLEAVAA